MGPVITRGHGYIKILMYQGPIHHRYTRYIAIHQGFRYIKLLMYRIAAPG